MKLLLIVAPQNEVTARQILQADFVQQTAQNTGGTAIAAAAVSNVNKGTAELVVWPQLSTNPDTWFLVETGMPVKPFLFQEEKPVALNALTQPESDHVFKRHEYLYQAYGRYNAGYGLPELAYGSDGSTDAT
ncbi:MAG: Mu-like prophage major head subunit gpT family protein [Chthoniobacteraceae bacterium]